MIGALRRYLVARWRLKAHQRRHGNLLPPCGAQVFYGWRPGMPLPDPTGCTLPAGHGGTHSWACRAFVTRGRLCTEPAGHHGPHRYRLGSAALHRPRVATHPDDPDGAPLVTPPGQRATFHRGN